MRRRRRSRRATHRPGRPKRSVEPSQAVTAWLLKTEPSEFSFNDLVARGVEPWDGIRNPFALRNLQAAQVGEPCVIYHTGDERQAVGLGSVARTAYPDPKQDDPRLVVIDVKAGERLENPVR